MYLHIYQFFVCLFETGSHFVALAGLELTVCMKLTLNSRDIPACLCLLGAKIKGVHHHPQILFFFFLVKKE